MSAAPHEILARATRIATVGMSDDDSKPAHRIPRQLIEAGFDIVPVNPDADEILGRPAFASLMDVPGSVDVVEVFRPADEAPEIAREAAQIGASALWLQAGIVSPEARTIAEEVGMDYVEDECMGRIQSAHDIRPA